MKANLKQRILVSVNYSDIDCGKTCDPNKCMIKIAVARAINVPHGYIKVDATGISVTRRTDFREKAFIPRTALMKMLQFDKDPENVKPFKFYLTFHKTTKVYKASEHRKERINQNRRENNQPSRTRKYGLAKRIQGISTTLSMLEGIQ